MKNLTLLLLAVAIAGCNPTTEDAENELRPIQDLFDSFYQESLDLDPLTGNFMGVLENMDTLPNYLSDSYAQRSIDFYNRYLTDLKQYDRATMNESDRINYDVLVWFCESVSEIDPALNSYLPINQFWSQNLSIAQFASGQSMQPFNTKEDYENWLSRLDDYTVWMDQALTNMQKGLELGYKQPKEVISKTIPQLESMANPELEQHLFFAPIQRMPDSISPADSLELANAYAEMINEQIKPRYRQLADFFMNDYAASPRSSSGIGSLPGGKEAYQKLIALSTNTDLTPDSIFNLGQSEVARIEQEMIGVMNQVGFDGSLLEFFDHVRSNKDLMPFTDPQQVINNFNDIHDRMLPNLERIFDMTPTTAFEVRRTEAFREKSASAQYNPGMPDGSKPGIFYVPIPDVTSYNVYGDEDLFLHEAIPGHHYQVMLELENTDIPDFRKYTFSGAYAEGWGLYAESLGKELGLYTDPYQYFGMLSGEMHRAIRLVVDVGLHDKGWTREEAIAYSLAHEGISEGGAIAEVERYMVLPAQALSYKIGQLTILSLRKKAETELGDRFDIKAFHRAILSPGSLPMKVLEQHIEDWINQEKAKTQ